MGREGVKKARISLTIDSDILRRIDKLCEVKKFSRPQVIEMIFSSDPKTVDFMTDLVKRIDKEMFM